MKINPVSSLALIFANLYPIYGLYFLGWDIIKIILLYFLESVIIAFFSLIKIYYCWNETENVPIRSYRQVYMEIFKAFFAYSFYLGLVFIFLKIFYFKYIDIYNYITFSGILIMIISHGISFYSNYIKNAEYEKTSDNVIVLKVFFLRLLPMHLIIILPFELKDYITNPIYISLFIIVKTLIDLFFHIIEHRNK